MILFFVSQESYVYTIGKKMNSFGPIKSEASKTTGKNSSGKLFMHHQTRTPIFECFYARRRHENYSGLIAVETNSRKKKICDAGGSTGQAMFYSWPAS